jgi:hypothetical protein
VLISNPLGLSSGRRRDRILDLKPMGRTSGTVGRAKALRDNALAAERARVLVDGRAVLAIGLIERDAFMREPEQAGQPALALLDRLESGPGPGQSSRLLLSESIRLILNAGAESSSGKPMVTPDCDNGSSVSYPFPRLARLLHALLHELFEILALKALAFAL